MKKVLLFLLPLLFSCSSSDPIVDTDPIKKEEKPVDNTKEKLVGVWKKGDYFFSFNSDGYYAAFLSSNYIDTGTYNYNNMEVSCSNNYNGKETKYTISSVSDTQINVKISFVDYNSEKQEISETFTKSSESPISKENILSGKSWGALYAGWGVCSTTFYNHNSGKFEITKTNCGLPNGTYRDLYYIYLKPKVYIQYYAPKGVGLSNFYNSCKGDIYIYNVSLTSNGLIEELKSLN